MADSDLPVEALALLDAIAVGENYDPAEYNELVGGGHFTGYQMFPIWEGIEFPTGRSHAAGRYQFEPATWKRTAEACHLTDFSPQSQDIGAWWLAQADYKARLGRTLLADLQRRQTMHLVAGLQQTWSSIIPGTEARYYGALAARRSISIKIAAAEQGFTGV